MPSIRKTIIFAFAAALAVVSLVYFTHRPKPPAPRQTVNSLYEIGALPAHYDGWLAHVQAEILAADDAPPFGDGGCYFLTVLPISLVPGKTGVLLHGREISTGELIDVIKNEPHSPILIRTASSTSLAEIEPVAKALIDAGFGDHVHPVLNGPRVDNVFSVKLAGRFLRVFTNSFQIVASLKEIGVLPKGYDGWLAHVEAEVLADGEERPEDPRYPPGGPMRTPFIVDVSADGSIFLNNTVRALPELIAVTKLSFEGQSEPDPIMFRAAVDARIEAVNAVALALVEGGFGDQLCPVLDGEKFARVYSIKLGERFMRVRLSGAGKSQQHAREVVTSLHELGILPKGYDGWLAHVEAELLTIGETRPANPLLPLDDSRLRSATIVSVTAKADVSLNSKTMTSDALVTLLKRISEGQTDLAPLLFEIPLEAPLSAVEPIARAINDGGFGAHQLLMIVGGEVLSEHSRVYSIKLGGRFIRL